VPRGERPRHVVRAARITPALRVCTQTTRCPSCPAAPPPASQSRPAPRLKTAPCPPLQKLLPCLKAAPFSPLASLTARSVSVPALVRGRLLEVNGRLVAHGSHLFNFPLREGYIGVLYPSVADQAALRASLLDEGAYLRLRGLASQELLL
jgi:hypothetical protein